MKALTVRQPHASFVAEGIKSSVTRSRMAPEEHWGTTIGIYAAKHRPRIEESNSQVREALLRRPFSGLHILPLGAVIATATLVGCAQVEIHDDAGNAVIKTSQRSIAYIENDGLDDYSIGRWVWLLSDIEKLPEPIPARGYQGLWTLHAGVEMSEA